MTTPAVSLAFSPAQAVAAAPEWWYFGRNYSYPRYNKIGLKSQSDKGDFARAPEVFAVLGLSPDALKDIYHWGQHDPVATFDDLGACPPAHEGWQQLARLTGKTIHFVQCSGESPFGGFEYAVYYPDGRIKEKKR